jgi:hypothetical protein
VPKSTGPRTKHRGWASSTTTNRATPSNCAVIEDIALADIDQELVLQVRRPIRNEKNTTAKTLRGRIAARSIIARSAAFIA